MSYQWGKRYRVKIVEALTEEEEESGVYEGHEFMFRV